MANGEWVRIRGLKETLRLLRDRPEWVEGPLREFFERWGSRGERKAKANLKRGKGGWIDTASTRKSITHATDSRPWPEWARFGSNLQTARWGDYGTGLLSEDPDSSKRRHWPPSHALEGWVAKKRPTGRDGQPMTAFQVARAIGLRGGLAPRRFIRDAAEDAEAQIPRYLGMLARDIEHAAREAR